MFGRNQKRFAQDMDEEAYHCFGHEYFLFCLAMLSSRLSYLDKILILICLLSGFPPGRINNETFIQLFLLLILLGGAQPVVPLNLYSMFMNIIAWGPQVTIDNAF